jgi:hypothetical protein
MKRMTYYPAFLFAVAILISTTGNVKAQDEESGSPISIGADLVSRYVWRGTDFGASPSIQPYIEASAWNFTLGAWGAYTTNRFAGQEMDLYFNYTIMDIVSVGVIDYFFPQETAAGYNYFDYKTDGQHILEATATFNGLEDLPLTATVGVNVLNDSNNSFYVELGYGFSIFDLFLGAGNGIYTTDNNFNVVSLGITASKEIRVTEKYSLPISASLITNPEAQKVYLVFGISF